MVFVVNVMVETFHVGGTASKVAEENRIVLKYGVIVKDIKGVHVEMDDGSWLFTRKGSMTVARIIEKHEIPSGAEVLVQDGDKVLKEAVLFKSKGSETIASDVANV